MIPSFWTKVWPNSVNPDQTSPTDQYTVCNSACIFDTSTLQIFTIISNFSGVQMFWICMIKAVHGTVDTSLTNLTLNLLRSVDNDLLIL